MTTTEHGGIYICTGQDACGKRVRGFGDAEQQAVARCKGFSRVNAAAKMSFPDVLAFELRKKLQQQPESPRQQELEEKFRVRRFAQ